MFVLLPLGGQNIFKKMADQVPLSSTNTIFTIIVLIVPGDLLEGASRQALL